MVYKTCAFHCRPRPTPRSEPCRHCRPTTSASLSEVGVAPLWPQVAISVGVAGSACTRWIDGQEAVSGPSYAESVLTASKPRKDLHRTAQHLVVQRRASPKYLQLVRLGGVRYPSNLQAANGTRGKHEHVPPTPQKGRDRTPTLLGPDNHTPSGAGNPHGPPSSTASAGRCQTPLCPLCAFAHFPASSDSSSLPSGRLEYGGPPS